MDPKTTALVNAAPPYGHVVCSEKWRTSSLLQGLKEAGLKILFENELAVADFLLPNKVCLLYVSEGDMVAGNGCRRKLVRYRNASSSFQQLVLAERTRLSEQYFSALQKFVVLDLGLSLLPVGGQTEVHGEGRENPFRRRTSCRLLDSITLALVQQIPGVGKVRAVTLMQNFPSIQEISNASPAELEPLVGQASAQQIHSFFHAHLTPGN
ncbi:Fanconi anemia core complex-associated protein 24-like [Cyprinodon tularosa]|uniref:Fanconi anemia core complex-associated protein 24-like n=1 Tax=Cyprinodon tularosa TaxID=77115 RepID=UPI0018E2085A|nr:Fanconi anemia core complex-associated protein 24-like [Cyprinodon tularosa]